MSLAKKLCANGKNSLLETVAQVRFQISCSRTDGFSRANRSCSALRSPIFPFWGALPSFWADCPLCNQSNCPFEVVGEAVEVEVQLYLGLAWIAGSAKAL